MKSSHPTAGIVLHGIALHISFSTFLEILSKQISLAFSFKNDYLYLCNALHTLLLFSHEVVFNSVTPWTAARQAPVSMGFPRQEYQSGLPLTSPRDLPDPRIELACPALAGRFFTAEPPGKPLHTLQEYK